MAIIAATLSLRSARKTAIDVFRIQELQLIATELPAAFNEWVTSVRAIQNHGQGNVLALTVEEEAENRVEAEGLIQAELNARRRLHAWKHRLDDSGDYIREEIDLAINAVLANDPNELDNRIAASSIFVNANLPSLVRDEVYERQHPIRSWFGRAKKSLLGE